MEKQAKEEEEEKEEEQEEVYEKIAVENVLALTPYSKPWYIVFHKLLLFAGLLLMVELVPSTETYVKRLLTSYSDGKSYVFWLFSNESSGGCSCST